MVRAPVRGQTYRNLLYLLLAFPLGIAYFVYVVVGVSVSASLTVVLVGVPLFLAVLAGGLVVAAVERKLTAALLGLDIPSDGWSFLRMDEPVAAVKALVTDVDAWIALVYLLSKFAIGIGAFVLQVTLLVTSGTLAAVPLFYDRPGFDVGVQPPAGGAEIPFSLYLPWKDLLVGVEFAVEVTEWQVDTFPEALLMSGVGLLALVASLNVLNAFAWLTGQYARLMLGPHDGLQERVRAVLP